MSLRHVIHAFSTTRCSGGVEQNESKIDDQGSATTSIKLFFVTLIIKGKEKKKSTKIHRNYDEKGWPPRIVKLSGEVRRLLDPKKKKKKNKKQKKKRSGEAANLFASRSLTRRRIFCIERDEGIWI